MQLVAEGVRKIATLYQLLKNGFLRPGDTLFWDEPEANLNPRLMDEVVGVLLQLARSGVQVFLATHNYVILKEFDLQAEASDAVRYFALEATANGTVAHAAEDYTEIAPNAIAEQFDRLYDLELTRATGEKTPAMRLAAFPVVESGLAFDFGAAVWCDKHDATNNVWAGVDFVLKEPNRQIWLEVKNWEGASVPARRRGGQRRSFLAKLRSKVFFTETLRAKFVGTCAYLALTGNVPREDLLYIALLESPRMDAALMLHATDRLRRLVKRDGIWHYEDASGVRVPIRVEAAVLNAARWNALFPEYPARAV